MKLYDSLTQSFKTINENKVTIYNCGPTVYNHIHIGNARPLIVFDVLFRFLKWKNVDVKYILNITDIDDKIINKAIQEQKNELEISDYYFNEYLKIKKQLNTIEMINHKVSDNIDAIIEYIDLLVQKDKAYIVDGDVYFDTKSINNYGVLSNNIVDDLMIGNRIHSNENKKNPNDFVLWKKTNIGLNWKTKWSIGRPGWHTECSCLINKYIGDQVTIHGGGMDLKFPHHENENAQNQALHNKDLADIWLHIGMININNQKMSKSLNNFILVKDILNKYDYKVLRWFFYQTNFNNPLNYSNEIMNNIENEIKKIEKSINVFKTKFILNDIDFAINNNDLDYDFICNLENNLNIANAISNIYDLIKKINIDFNNKKILEAKNNFDKLINSLQILGIEFINQHNNDVLNKIKTYKKYLQNNDYENSDLIRNDLIKNNLF